MSFDVHAATDAVTLAEQHGAELLSLGGGFVLFLVGAVISLLLWGVKREVAATNKTLEFTNEMLRLFRKEVADDVQLLRDDQRFIRSDLSETKKRVGLAERDIAVITSNCKLYRGVERRKSDRNEEEN